MDSIPVDYVPELRQRRPWIMEEMVAAEPSLVSQVLGSAEPAGAIADLVRKAVSERSPVVVTGCGTSETAAMAVADLIADALRQDRYAPSLVQARQALEASLDPRPGGVCLGISHEGSTRATNLALEAARGAGAATALITARAGSAATKLADAVFTTPLIDRSWCHTVGYLSPLLAGAAIARSLGGSAIDAAGLHAALRDDSIGRQAASLAARLLPGVDRLVITGAGPDRSPARELALKIEEGVWLPARMLDLETVLHGHLAACDARTGMIVVATDARKRLMVRTNLLIEAANRIGIRVGAIVSSAMDSGLEGTIDRIVLPREIDSYGLIGRLACSALALQHLTLALANLAGTNPDLIRRQQENYREAARIAESSSNW